MGGRELTSMEKTASLSRKDFEEEPDGDLYPNEAAMLRVLPRRLGARHWRVDSVCNTLETAKRSGVVVTCCFIRAQEHLRGLGSLPEHSTSTLDVTTTNQASLSRKRREENTGWSLRGALTRFDRRFDVFEVSKTGGLRRTSVTLAEVMAEFGVHARDLLSLGLQDERYNPPPAVLPRDGVVVVALGPLKALIHTEACLVFEAGKGDIARIASLLAELMRANAKVPTMEASRRPLAEADQRRGGTRAGAGAGGGAVEEKMAKKGSKRADSTSKVVNTAVISGGETMAGSSRETRGRLGAIGEAESSQTGRGSGVREGDALFATGKLKPSLGIGRQEGRSRSEDGTDLDGDPEDREKSEMDGIQVHPMMVMFSEQMPMPFELAMLEAMLQEVCASYNRRTQIVHRLMERGLEPHETSTFFAPNRLDYYRVVPLKLALKQLQLKLSEIRTCLEDLMHSDEDMLGLLLTEAKGLRKGEILDHRRHSVVELLLENYHRQLVLVDYDVASMKQEMESMQELAAMSLDVSRNSMIAVDIRLAMMNLAVASSGCLFGAMGMNVVNGLEESHLAFYALLGGSAAFSAIALTMVMRYLRSMTRSGDSQQGELIALNTICEHVDDLESVLRTDFESRAGGIGDGLIRGEKTPGLRPDGVMIDRDAMAKRLSRARGKDISKGELDLIFKVFDTTGDGAIDRDEYGLIVNDAVGCPGKGGR